jgi:co-chaperonin GroES (HSP10)
MIQPLGSNVVVKRIIQDSVGGIHLPDKANKKIELIAVAVGPDVKTIQVNDSIICMPTDCMFFVGWSGVDEAFGIVLEEKIRGKICPTLS